MLHRFLILVFMFCLPALLPPFAQAQTMPQQLRDRYPSDGGGVSQCSGLLPQLIVPPRNIKSWFMKAVFPKTQRHGKSWQNFLPIRATSARASRPGGREPGIPMTISF